nr:hypothetical protein [Rhodococcus sp. MTM3W5.2]
MASPSRDGVDLANASGARSTPTTAPAESTVTVASPSGVRASTRNAATSDCARDNRSDRR